MRNQLGNAKRGAPGSGRDPVRYVDLLTSSGHFGSVTGQCKIVQDRGRVIAEGDGAKVVQVRVMAAG